MTTPRRRLVALAVLVAITASCDAAVPTGGDATGPTADAVVAAPDGAWEAVVNRIVDGDTLVLDVVDPGVGGAPDVDRVRGRLLRIDTPELARDGRPAECLAEAATDHLADLVPLGTMVLAAHDVEELDQYDRDLVHLWTLDGTWVNGAMLADGFANVVTFPPNVAHDDEVRALEAAARAAGRGLWDPDAC